MFGCIDNVLNADQLAEVAHGLAELEFIDGVATAGFHARRVKKNHQAKSAGNSRTLLNTLVVEALMSNDAIRRIAMPRRIRPPLISRYRAGMAYGTHVDDALMGKGERTRTDVSVTLFLNSPTEYDGGKLVIETPYGEREVKLAAGAVAIYPATTLHRVEPVTRGERLVAVTWIESYVRDAARREMLADLDVIRRVMAENFEDQRETDLAFKTYANLLRLWSEP